MSSSSSSTLSSNVCSLMMAPVPLLASKSEVSEVRTRRDIPRQRAATHDAIPTSSRAGTRLAAKLYRTKLCKYYPQGNCTFGNACCFAHTVDEVHEGLDLRKTKLCIAFMNGGCRKLSEDCPFAHSHEELRHAPNRERTVQETSDFAPTCPEAGCDEHEEHFSSTPSSTTTSKDRPNVEQGAATAAVNDLLDKLKHNQKSPKTHRRASAPNIGQREMRRSSFAAPTGGFSAQTNSGVANTSVGSESVWVPVPYHLSYPQAGSCFSSQSCLPGGFYTIPFQFSNYQNDTSDWLLATAIVNAAKENLKASNPTYEWDNARTVLAAQAAMAALRVLRT